MDGLDFKKLTQTAGSAPSHSGVICSSLTATGPTLLFLCLLALMKWVLVRFSMEETVAFFFLSSFLWLFLPVILIAALFGSLGTRYISDQIFSGKNMDLSASVLGMLTVQTTLSAAVIFLMLFLLGRQAPVPMKYLVPCYLSGVLFSCSCTLMTYLFTIREYRKSILPHILGMAVTVGVIFLLQKHYQVPLLRSMWWGLSAGLFLACLFLSSFCIRSFGSNSGRYFQFLTYGKSHLSYILSDFFWVLSLYLPGILMWFLSSSSVKIMLFRLSPQFDLALSLALAVNLAGIMLFEVRTQTRVFSSVLNYLTALDQGSYDDIQKQQQHLQREMGLQLFFSYEVQLVTVLILSCLTNVLSPYLGLSPELLDLCMVLIVGMYGAFCMHFTLTFFHYLDDSRYVLWGPVLSLLLIVLCSFLLKNEASLLQALPLAVGSISGGLLSFLLLRNRITSLTAYYFCE